MITYSDFTIDFPEFADAAKYSQVRVERAIARASTQVDNEIGTAPELIGYLAAHILAISSPGTVGGAGTGAISSLSVSGEYSVTYAGETQGTGNNPLNATPYGREFQRLLASLSFTPVIV